MTKTYKYAIIMKRFLLTFALFPFFILCASAQGRSISREKKIMDPYITSDGDTLSVSITSIQLLDCSGDNNQYRYVQLLNNFNEPIQPATSKQAMKRQTIKFFKSQDDVMYAFTEYFCKCRGGIICQRNTYLTRKVV